MAHIYLAQVIYRGPNGSMETDVVGFKKRDVAMEWVVKRTNEVKGKFVASNVSILGICEIVPDDVAIRGDKTSKFSYTYEDSE